MDLAKRTDDCFAVTCTGDALFKRRWLLGDCMTGQLRCQQGHWAWAFHNCKVSKPEKCLTPKHGRRKHFRNTNCFLSGVWTENNNIGMRASMSPMNLETKVPRKVLVWLGNFQAAGLPVGLASARRLLLSQRHVQSPGPHMLGALWRWHRAYGLGKPPTAKLPWPRRPTANRPPLCLPALASACRPPPSALSPQS